MKENFRVPILAYHSIDNSGSVISIDTTIFKDQMRFLKDYSFNVISLDEVVMRIRKRTPFAEKSIAITFDDGFKNVYTDAFPVLKEYGFNATVFLTTNYCEKLNNWPSQPDSIKAQPLLSWADVKEMSRSGMQFGAHTHNHPSLTKVPMKDAENEILLSKKVIEDKLQEEINSFAYPYGDFNTNIVNIVNQHFTGACSTKLAIANSKSNPFLLERVDVFYIKSGMVFKRLLTPYVSCYLKCRRLLRDMKAGYLEKGQY
jgi:peptidoglycan/xylan/chitin deacetylase (PgdA/CDA1 family)